MKIQKICKCCGEEVIIDMSRESYELYLSGMHIQDAAPDLTPDEREIMVSGICGKCFDDAFDEEDDDI